MPHQSLVRLAVVVIAGVAASACEAVTGTDDGASGSWAAVSAGGSFVCGTTTDMRAYCWGSNDVGQLGVGSAEGPERCGESCSTRPVEVAGDHRFTSIATGDAHACGLTPAGAVYCWGSNARGQIGAQTGEICATEACVTSPTLVSTSLVWSAITAGSEHTCALAQTGQAYCWGSNFWGQLGNGTRSETGGTFAPAAVVGGLTWKLLSAGATHTCGITTDGRAYCWGFSMTGALGTATPGTGQSPLPVAGDLAFETISADVHTCGVTTDREALCWGSNAFDQLGVGPTTLGPENCTATVHPCSTRPAPIAGAVTFSELVAGPTHTCAIAAIGGDAYCWGDNSWGQLGTATTERANRPLRVSGGLAFETLTTGGVQTIAGTAAVTCGVTVDGDAYCWGSNRRGELGRGAWSSGDDNPPGRATPGLVAAPREE